MTLKKTFGCFMFYERSTMIRSLFRHIRNKGKLDIYTLLLLIHLHMKKIIR